VIPSKPAVVTIFSGILINFGLGLPMTLSLAWIRSVGNVQELVMATDSRLRRGRAWDVAPKILTLPRTDCAICFAGDTDDAYPFTQ